MTQEHETTGQPARRRGFAAMSKERQREIARLGGRAAHEQGTAHEFTTDEAREAGRQGGKEVSRNRDHMASIGRRGGETVSRDRSLMAERGRRGGLRRAARYANQRDGASPVPINDGLTHDGTPVPLDGVILQLNTGDALSA